MTEVKNARGRPPVKVSSTSILVDGKKVVAETDDPNEWILNNLSNEANTPGILARILFPNGNVLQRILIMYRDMYETITFNIRESVVYIMKKDEVDKIVSSVSCTKIEAGSLPDGYYYFVGDGSRFGVSFNMSLLDIKDICSQMSKNPVELVFTDNDVIRLNMFSPNIMLKKSIQFPAEKAIEVFDAERYLGTPDSSIPLITRISFASKTFCSEVPFSKTNSIDDLIFQIKKNVFTTTTKIKNNDVSVSLHVEESDLLDDLDYRGVFPAKKIQSFIRGSSKLNVSVSMSIYDKFLDIRYNIPDIGISMLSIGQKS